MRFKKNWLIPVLLILSLILTSGCINSIFYPEGVKYPSIDHRDSEPEYVMISDSFSFQESEVSVKYYVDKILYEDAKSTDKSAYLYEDFNDKEWSADYYRSFVNSEYMDEVYKAVLGSLRQLKTQMSLNDDEYAELISVYVQSIPYQTDDTLTEPKYAIETVYGDSGDCDDKSILLSGLLLKEGYDVALLEYDDEEHMNVGIKSDGCQYRNTGYATIETTDVNLIGWEKIKIGDGGELLESDPLVIKLGNEGGLRYTACGEVEEIYDTYEESAELCKELSSRINKDKSELESLESEINNEIDLLNQLKRSGEIFRYNSMVQSYNSKVNIYNEKADSLQSLVDEYNECVEVYNTIIETQYDRKKLYDYVGSV